MSEKLWSEVERAFAGAIELPVEERARFLDKAALESEVRRRVEDLLQAWSDSDGFLETPAAAAPVLPESPASGTTIGPWLLLEELGSGGMGTVYRARRDGEFTQEAALKLIASGGLSRDIARRFREERQILARLEHPSIARLIDGGVAPGGTPYLVMEFVPGIPINQWCRDRSLGVREKLELFRRVCAAVEFSHKNLVVHCDLKPANILVTEDGTPKLLDFGIAKLLADAGESTGTLLRAMTPDYASPEQVRGLPLNTTSDIYSLGVVLYELLAGDRPYRLTGMTLDEVMATVCEREVKKLQSGSADIDAIVAKAVRKDPAERYGSAAELSADLARFLDGHPVLARQQRSGYVLRKFVTRHRWAVSAGAVACALLIAAGVAIVHESQLSARRFAEVRQLARFVIFDMHDAIRPLAGSTPARKLLVGHALQYLDRLAADGGGNEELQREMATAYLRIGDVSGKPTEASLGDFEQAIGSYRKALAIAEPLAAKHPDDARLGSFIVICYQSLNSVYVFTRRPREALDAVQHAVAAHERITRAEPSDWNREQLANNYVALATALSANGRSDQQIEYLKKSIPISEEVLAHDPGNRQRQRNAALGHKQLGGAILSLDPAAAELHLQRAEELDRNRAAGHPEDRQAQLDLSFDYSQDAEFQYAIRHNPKGGLELYQKALAIRLELLRSDPSNFQLRDRSVYAANKVAEVSLALHLAAEAKAQAKAAIELSGKLPVASSPGNRQQLARSQALLAQAEAALGHAQASCAAWTQALANYRQSATAGKTNEAQVKAIREAEEAVQSCR